MHAQTAADYIQQQANGFTPRIALLCGSGLNSFVDHIDVLAHIDYADIPHFPTCGVAGHQGTLTLGHYKDVPLLVLQGRPHFYEGATGQDFQTFIHTTRQLGCDTLIILSAVGSLQKDWPPGTLVQVTDHMNFQFNNPLAGPVDETFGNRFFSLNEAYSPALRASMKHTADSLNIALQEGVYVGTIGPSFETAAEIRAYRMLGADIVGMSTLPSVIVARHCGLKVAAIGAITNLAEGLSDVTLSHDVTLQGATKAAAQVEQLLAAWVPTLNPDVL